MDISEAEQEYMDAIQSSDPGRIEAALKSLQVVERRLMIRVDWSKVQDFSLKREREPQKARSRKSMEEL